ncbi:trypsin-like serine protease, partial [Thozetella sp. PMI_491]
MNDTSPAPKEIPIAVESTPAVSYALAPEPVTAAAKDDGDQVEIRPPPRTPDDDIAPRGGSEAGEWEATIKLVVGAVVSVSYRTPFGFDENAPGSARATGFVVDAERGLILTNRHVVGPGPFRGFCIFDNHEEVDAFPVYQDPIHDFGFLKFDPKAVKHMTMTSLELHPEHAKIGVEIRVVGNDAGEKLSILSGFISRVDRNAPAYSGPYTDFNTCYYQASAGTSGGSSGSPVVDINGSVLAINAGSKKTAATGYFLPLHAPLRALKCLQQGQPILRGDIQCQFLLKPFDECKRLGLSEERETQIREAFPGGTNLLVATRVLREGPSDGLIEEGDILFKAGGQFVAEFDHLETTMDSHVGEKVEFLVIRGGQDVTVDITIGNLHEFTPDRMVHVAGAGFHEVSYQIARRYGVPRKGVLLNDPNGVFRGVDGSLRVLETIDNKEVPDLDTFIEVMKGISDRARVVVAYRNLANINSLKTAIVYIDRHWTKDMTLAIRNDETGVWDFTVLASPLPPFAPTPQKASSFMQLENVPHPAVSDLVRSFVNVDCFCKFSSLPGNLHQASTFGMGLVVDASKGLVIVSRAVVPFDVCDISITIAGSILVEGKVLFLHPVHNYAVLQYDPAFVDAPVASAELSAEEITQGESINFIGWSKRSGELVHAVTTVSRKTPISLPADSYPPRCKASNVDVLSIDTKLGERCGSGVLVGNDGIVRALWLTFVGDRTDKGINKYHYGLATPMLLSMISQIREGLNPKLRLLPVQLGSITFADARLMGVREERIMKAADANPQQYRLFKVEKSYDADNKETALVEGDIVLTSDKKVITRLSELDAMYSQETLETLVLRRCREVELKLATLAVNDVDTTRLVQFCGATIHQPDHSIRLERGKIYSGVYISYYTYGSPAQQYKLLPPNFITQVNGKPTPDLDSFLETIVTIPNNEYFRVKKTSLNGVHDVVTMKKDEHYFPTIEWRRDASQPLGWKKVVHGNVAGGRP